MAIKVSELLPPSPVVKINGKDVTINALSLEQVIRLLTAYRTDLVMMFSDSVDGALNMVTIVATAPVMVADIIACGIDADGQQEDIMKLPGFTQVELLSEIWKVSVPDPKKLLSLLSGAMEALQEVGVSPSLPESEPIQPTLESPAPTALEQESTTSLTPSNTPLPIASTS